MENPFDKHFKKLQQEREAELRRQEQARQLAEQTRIKGIQVTKDLDEMVLSVLRQLQQASYPRGDVRTTDPDKNQHPFVGRWYIEVRHTGIATPGLPPPRAHTTVNVEVKLELDLNYDPLRFHCQLLSNDGKVQRETQASVSREELIASLRQLYPTLPK